MYTLLSKNAYSLIMCMCAGLCVVCTLGCGCPQRPVAARSLEQELQIVVSRPRCVLVAEVGFSAQAVHTPHCLVISAAPMWSALAVKMYSSSETVFKLPA